MPFFSILVPTRNRSKLLVESAIPSILEQDFDDYEIVICDNNSTDNTREVVEKLMKNNDKIRYVYSAKWIPKEKFFEFSLLKAKGEYSILFFDDDVFVKNVFKFCYNILSKFSPPVLTFPNNLVYFYGDWYVPEMKNTLRVPFYTKEIIIKDAKKQLEKIYNELNLIPGTPDVTNSFYKTSFIIDLIKKYATLFPYGHMGDYNIACYTLANIDYYLYYDGPIIIFGHWSQNTTQQLRLLQTTMKEYAEWIEWVKENLLSMMPFKEYIFPNCIAATLYKMKEELSLPYEIDFSAYVRVLFEYIGWMKELKVEVSEIERKFKKFLKENEDKIKKDFKFKREMIVVPSPEIFNGCKYGFNNILEARDFFDNLQKGNFSEKKMKKRIYEKIIFHFLKITNRALKKILGIKIYRRVLKQLKKLGIYVLSKIE